MRRKLTFFCLCFWLSANAQVQFPDIDVQHYTFNIGLNDHDDTIKGQAAIEVKFAIVETVVAGGHAIGGDDIGEAIAVEIAHDGVACRPFRIAVLSADAEVAFAVIEEDELGVGRIVAEDDIEVTALGHVGERSGVALDGLAGQRRAGSEMTFTVAKKGEGRDLPVTAFDEDDIGVSIAIEVADAGVGGGFGDRFQRDYFKRT